MPLRRAPRVDVVTNAAFATFFSLICCLLLARYFRYAFAFFIFRYALRYDTRYYIR